MKRAGVVVVASLCLSPVVAPSVRAAPTPTIVTCNFPVTQSIILQNSLFGCTNDGLRVMADNVTIDLNGHTIDGNATDDVVDVEEAGIDNTGKHTGIVVKNGTLRDFESGAFADNGGGGRFEDVDALDNGRGLVLFSSPGNSWSVRRSTAGGNAGDGFVVGGPGSVVGNRSTGNGANGFRLNTRNGAVRGNAAISNAEDGFNLSVPLPASVRGNRAIGNGDDGFDSFISPAVELVSNVARSNRSDGFEVGNVGHTFVGNRAEGNSGNGFYAFSGRGHRFIENAAVGNGANGLLLTDEFSPAVAEVTMRLNNASGNRGDGMDLDVDTLKVIENKANRNGFDNGDDDASGLGIRDSGSTDVTARRNRADGNADATECSPNMGCT